VNEASKLVTTSQKEHLSEVETVVARLEALVNEASKGLSAYTKKGFLRKLMAGSDPSEVFEKYEKKLKDLLNQLDRLLSLSIACVVDRTYTAVAGIEQWVNDCGGMEQLSKDRVKLAMLAEKLGETNYLHESLFASIL
jgi:hypothetical protein